jgi:hypothetical protein
LGKKEKLSLGGESDICNRLFNGTLKALEAMILKNYRTILYLVIMMYLILFILGGCDNETKNAKKIAYISTTKHSQYAKTFTDLHLGIIYDFNLRLTEADKSWVTLWVEGYENGEKTEPFRLIELSYGLNPTPVSEGPMGLVLCNW